MSVVDDLSNHASQRCHDILDQAIALVADPKQRFEISLRTVCGLLGVTAALLRCADSKDPSEATASERLESYRTIIGMLVLTVEEGSCR